MSASDRPTTPCPFDPAAYAAESESKIRSGEVAPPSPQSIPWLMLSHRDVLELGLDHREGFLLSLIDGRTTVETLLDLSPMAPKEALQLLTQWLALGVIELHEAGADDSGMFSAGGAA